MTNSPPICGACGATLFPDDHFCVDCGAPAGPAPEPGQTRARASLQSGQGAARSCAACSADLQADAAFCPSCGAAQPVAPSRSPRVAEVVLPVGRMDPWVRVRRRLEAAVRGEFTVEREIGRGGMAAVFLAKDVTLGRQVAIKVMVPGLLTGRGTVERFAREAVTVAGLNHPSIVSIYTVRHLDDLHFFVMQFVDGRSLRQVLEVSGRLPIDAARAILYQVGTALAFAHRRGVIHRDVKPANIHLDMDGNAVVMDFGIAKVPAQVKHTQTGATIGTPAYMSPEQSAGREVSWSSDQYSLGVVAWEMLAGRPPFSGNPFALMQAHAYTPAPALRPERPDCPPALEAAVLRMLAKHPGERFESMTAALDALGARPVAVDSPVQKVLSGLATAAPEAASTPLAVASSEARPVAVAGRRGWLVAGAVAALVVAGLAWMAFRPRPTAGGDVIPMVASLALSAVSESLAVAGSKTLRATPLDSAGSPLPAPIAWRVGDTSIATLVASGTEAVVTARRPGRTVILVSSEAVTGTIDLVVAAPVDPIEPARPQIEK